MTIGEDTDETSRVHRAARFARAAALTTLAPADRALLRVNGKHGFPPIHLRRQNGPLHGFERVAGEYVGMFAALGLLSPSSSVVDAGCGSAALLLALSERLNSSAKYVGFDVNRAVIDWARKAFRDDSRVEFQHYDYFSSGFNPKGKRGLTWPTDNNSADLIVLKSVFTHLLPADAQHFITEIRRTLSPGGTAFVTAFTYNHGQSPDMFPHQGSGFRYIRANAPEAGIALPQSWLAAQFQERSLNVEFRPGFWRGLDAGQLAYQDVFLVTRERTTASARS